MLTDLQKVEMSTKTLETRKKIEYISTQFLCCVQMKSFQWENIFQNLTYDLQNTLLNETVNSELVLKLPIQTSYQKAFLKQLIEKLEEQGTDIHDELYSAYGRLVSLPSLNGDCFKHYRVRRSGKLVSLKENVNLISDGTTGLRTWQAALVMSEWAVQNEEYLRNKVILELGSGIGLTGLVIAIECLPDCIYLTDCHPSVLKTLRDNVALNTELTSTPKSEDTMNLKEIRDRVLYSNKSHSGVQTVVLNLPWEDINEYECIKLGKLNTVLAADVVYDSSVFKTLINAIQCLAKFCSVEEFIFSCTERNKQTIEDFITQIGMALFTIEELSIPEQKNFIWPTDTPIRIFRFKVS